MATYSWSMAIVKRSEGRSVVAAAAYYSREALTDLRTSKTHDYRDRGDLEHSEFVFPPDAPAWCQDIDREAFWNKCEEREVRRDAQLARTLRIMIPREFSPEDRIRVVREYLYENFAKRGMAVDASWHAPLASDGKPNPHCHALITMRHLSADGFGLKSRHYMIPDPDGRCHPDGRPVLVASNKESWNTPEYFETCRERWEVKANSELERIGSNERIDRRSLLARGIARLPEPALRLAFHLKELRGVMKTRWGQFQMARHYGAVEQRAKAAFRVADQAAANPTLAAASPKRTVRDSVTPQPGEASRLFQRFHNWVDRQIERLGPAPKSPSQNHNIDLER